MAFHGQESRSVFQTGEKNREEEEYQPYTYSSNISLFDKSQWLWSLSLYLTPDQRCYVCVVDTDDATLRDLATWTLLIRQG